MSASKKAKLGGTRRERFQKKYPHSSQPHLSLRSRLLRAAAAEHRVPENTLFWRDGSLMFQRGAFVPNVDMVPKPQAVKAHAPPSDVTWRPHRY